MQPIDTKEQVRNKFCRVAVQSPKAIHTTFCDLVTMQEELGIRNPRESKSIEVSPAGVVAFRVLGEKGRDLQTQLDAFEIAHQEIGLDVAVSLYGHKMEMSDCADFASGIREIDKGILTVLFAQRSDKTFSYISTHSSLNEFDGFINGQAGGLESSKRQMQEILQQNNIGLLSADKKANKYFLGQKRPTAVIRRWQSIHEKALEKNMPEYMQYISNLER